MKRPLRRKVDGSICIACLQYFSSMELFLNHLAEKSQRCYVVYTLIIPDMCDDDCSAAHDLHRKKVSTILAMGIPRNHALDPIVR